VHDWARPAHAHEREIIPKVIYKYIYIKTTSIARDYYYLELISGSRVKIALARKKAHCIDALVVKDSIVNQLRF